MIGIDQAFAPLQEHDIVDARKSRPPEAWRPVLPVPDDAPPPTTAMMERFAPAGFRLAQNWRYHNGAGRLLGLVARYEARNGSQVEKQIRPFTYCEAPGGRREWRCKGFPEPRPLYGLQQLAERPGTPVLVAEGEKSADAAAKRFPDQVVVTSPGGCKAAGLADWSPLAGREVVIWRDADEPGARYAEDVAEKLRIAGAVSVRLVDVPADFPIGWDLADEVPEGFDADLRKLIADAPVARTEAPIPLFPPLPTPERYPIEALGPVLSRAAAAISRKVQVADAIAAQSVLAAAALAAQAHADVMLPYGQKRPLSLYFVTVAGSGDRKSTADNEALWPIRKRERVLKEQNDHEFKTWSIEHAAWSAEKRKIEGKANLGLEGRKQALRDLGSEPERPLHPFLTAPDPTVEGLAKAWPNAPAALGIFTAEGGQFIGGHGMSQDNRLKTAAVYSELWDGHPIKRIRAGDGSLPCPCCGADQHRRHEALS